jgi:hypothetical protein
MFDALKRMDNAEKNYQSLNEAEQQRVEKLKAEKDTKEKEK